MLHFTGLLKKTLFNKISFKVLTEESFFPSSKTVEIEQFIKEVEEIAFSDEIWVGARLHPLLFDSQYGKYYWAMKEFLENKEGVQVLYDDKQAEGLKNLF